MRIKILASLFALLLAFQTAGRADIGIMPLGDSITFGAHLHNGGYRYVLFVNLTQAGIGFHYLGQNTDNSEPLPYPEQRHHNGYPGATIIDLLNNLDGDLKGPAMVVPTLGGYWMTSGKAGGDPVNPDVILLLAGTNNIIHPLGAGGTDLAGMQSQFTGLIKWLTKNRPNATILIGTVLPITHPPSTQNDQVVGFNKWLKDNVASFGPKCSLVDLYSLFLKPDGTIDASLFGDGVHPSQAGYDIMGKAWSDAIGELVANGTLKKEAPPPFGPSFALPTGRQSPMAGFSGTRISPVDATPGTAVTISATLAAGNNALSAPVIGYTLKDSKPNPVPAVAVPSSVTLANLAPHQEAPLNISFKLPDKIEPGVYTVGITATAPEGTVEIRYGGKITVLPQTPYNP